jgi:hypothetical protein
MSGRSNSDFFYLLFSRYFSITRFLFKQFILHIYSYAAGTKLREKKQVPKGTFLFRFIHLLPFARVLRLRCFCQKEIGVGDHLGRSSQATPVRCCLVQHFNIRRIRQTCFPQHHLFQLLI